MLLELPQEIILGIARKLKFQDKLTLMQTCQRLNNLISNRCLYEKLVIIGNESDSKRIIERFQTKKLCNLQVKKLYYHLTLLSDDFFAQFPDIFPNISRYVDISPKLCKEQRTDAPTIQLMKWKDTLEYYKATDDWFKMASLMQTYTFSRLSFLYLSCAPGHSKKDIRRSIQFLDCIKNAPSLKTLHLDKCAITLTFLETVHSSCVQLQTLKIDESFYLMENESLPSTIVPAKQLFYLEISSLASFADEKCIFFDYIATKYTSLKQLIFYPLLVDETDVLHICYPDEFQDQYDTIGNSIIAALVKRIELTHSLYRDEAAIFLSRLPDTIKKLEFNGDMFNNVPEALEQSNIKPVDLIIQQRTHNQAAFNKPEQLACLEKLISVKNIELQLCPSVISFNYEGVASVSIVHLKTFITKAFDYRNVDLGWLLSAFPALENLDIYSMKNAFYISKDSIHRIHLGLKKLSIMTPTLHPAFFTLLSVLAPNIKELTLRISDEDVSNISQQERMQVSMVTQLLVSETRLTVDMMTFSQLDTFHFYFIRSKKLDQGFYTRNDVYYKIKVGDETKRLICRNGEIIMPVEAYHNKNKIKKLPKVTLLCRQFNKIVLNNGANITLDKDRRIVIEEIDLFQRLPVVCSLEL